MTLLSIIIGKKSNSIENTILLSASFYLNDYYYFQKKGIKEFCIFTARNTIFFSKHNQLENINYKEFYITILRKSKNLAVCIILNKQDYPINVLNRLIHKIYIDYENQYSNKWQEIYSDFSLPLKELDEKIILYQDPIKADKFHQINHQLEETKKIMYKNIDKILERGIKIDELVKKSKDLSLTSKKFYKQSKKFNRCCIIL